MPTRRSFLRTSLQVGASAGLSLLGLPQVRSHDSDSSEMQNESPSPIELTGAIRSVHDPVIIKAGDTYYLFSTGAGISLRKSTDMRDWELSFPTRVLGSNPDWTQEAVPGSTDFWAPDIAYFNDKYHLYYSVSTFGSNRSAIGLVTNRSLNFGDDDYGWMDEGLVISSTRGNNYNCIDPNVIIDEDGNAWLAFGSFWSGIKMRRLDYNTGKLSEDDTTLYSLAQRTVNSGAVEAPFIIYRGEYYYLFVSFDFCCRGVESTYHVRVGRSPNVTGPYVDRDGIEMLDGGGTQVTFPTDQWRGPGHNSIWRENGIDYIVYHAYDATRNGVFTLRIDPLTWDNEGWPSINGNSSSE